MPSKYTLKRDKRGRCIYYRQVRVPASEVPESVKKRCPKKRGGGGRGEGARSSSSSSRGGGGKRTPTKSTPPPPPTKKRTGLKGVTKKTANKKKGCRPQYTKKYLSRPSPNYPANECKGRRMKGNDGRIYQSVPDKNGIYRWKLVK